MWGGEGGGRRGGQQGRTDERPRTDHGISGPMRGPEKIAPDGAHTQNHGHGDSITEPDQWGRFIENSSALTNG